MTNQSLLSVTQADIDAVNQHARNKINFGESLAEAFARHRLDHTAPADVALRWEGDKLWLGDCQVATVWLTEGKPRWSFLMYGAVSAPTLTEARTAAEQSVRDWLARAGLVRQGGEPVACKHRVVEHDSKGRKTCISCGAAGSHPPASPTAEVVEAAVAALAFLRSAPMESGYCCCGSAVDQHGMGDGHSPVDELAYYANQVADQLSAALAKVQKP